MSQTQELLQEFDEILNSPHNLIQDSMYRKLTPEDVERLNEIVKLLSRGDGDYNE